MKTLLTSNECLVKYGDPKKESSMTLWVVPKELHIENVPYRIYCNTDMIAPLSEAFSNLIKSGFDKELKTWDGCFNIRFKINRNTYSLHSWGVAVDLNAKTNGYNKPTTLSSGFVDCFKKAGFDWGGDWRVKDGMHFQLSKT